MTHPKVDFYIENTPQPTEILQPLRSLLLECGLDEEWKWNLPAYTYKTKVIVVIQPFKQYCALLFYKGYLLKDEAGILIKTGENTRVGRQVRFETAKDVERLSPILKTYIFEAIELEKSGVKAAKQPAKALPHPEELTQKLEQFPAFKTAFYALTPGRQRAYIIHFSQPKQSKTRQSRIEKCIPQILDGKGMNDDYI